MKVRRITPEEVVEAYQTTGLKPGRDHYFPAEGYACGLGALARLHAGATDFAGACEWISQQDNFGTNDSFYDAAFANGFDGGCYFTNTVGYADGEAAWKAIVEAGLVGDAVE